MSDQLILNNYGTTTENKIFQAPQGTLLVDVENPAIHVHDGVTKGGTRLEPLYQPTDDKQYVLTKSGWQPIEEGGYMSVSTGVFELSPFLGINGEVNEIPAPKGMYVTDVFVRVVEPGNAQLPGVYNWPLDTTETDSDLELIRISPAEGFFYIYEGSGVNKIHQYSLSRGELTHTIDDVGSVRDMRVSPDGTILTWVAEGYEDDLISAVNVVDWSEKTLVNRPTVPAHGAGKQVRFDFEGRYLYVTSGNSSKDGFYRFTMSNGASKKLTDMGTEDYIQSFDISPDGKYLYYVADGDRYFTIFTYDLDNDVVINRVPIISPYTGREDAVKVELSPDGRRLVVALEQGILVYNTTTWEPIHASKRATHGVNVMIRDIAFSSDGLFLHILYDNYSPMVVLETTTWEIVFSQTLPGKRGMSVSIHPLTQEPYLLVDRSDEVPSGMFVIDQSLYFGSGRINYLHTRVILSSADDEVYTQGEDEGHGKSADTDVMIPLHNITRGAVHHRRPECLRPTTHFTVVYDEYHSVQVEVVLTGHRVNDLEPLATDDGGGGPILS